MRSSRDCFGEVNCLKNYAIHVCVFAVHFMRVYVNESLNNTNALARTTYNNAFNINGISYKSQLCNRSPMGRLLQDAK